MNRHAASLLPLLVVACGKSPDTTGDTDEPVDTEQPTATPVDTDEPVDSEPDVDTDVPPETDTPGDSATDTSLPVSYTGPSIADFIGCRSTLDCPNGVGWRCIDQIPLSRTTTAGTEFIAVTALWPQATLPGICTEVCSLNEAPCAGLSLDGTAVSQFTCQVVHVAETAYPDPAPPFDFDSALDDDELALGPVYAAVCRAPWNLDPAHLDESCDPCTDDSTCGGGLCWSEPVAVPSAPPAPGVCVESCSTAVDCPLGFTCADSGGATYCLPDTGTCGPCVDADGDGFGIGHCPRTGEDCDDADADAFLRASVSGLDDIMSDRCASHDLNCNGIDDETEIAGSEAYGLIHCAACNDTCAFTTTDPHATLACAGSLGCQADCDVGFEDCDGDYANGCEAVLATAPPSWLDVDGDGVGCRQGEPGCVVRGICPAGPAGGYVLTTGDCDDADGSVGADAEEIYLDSDGDGFFAPTVPPTFGCEAPTGGALARDIAALDIDCDDNNAPSTYPGAPEQCNGVDDDCSGEADDNIQPLTTGSAFFTEDADGDGYAPAGATTANLCISPTPVGWVRTPATGDDCDDGSAAVNPGADELCSPIDEDCDCPPGAGADDACRLSGADPFNASLVTGAACTYQGRVGMCGEGLLACRTTGLSCEPVNDQTRYPERFDNPFTPGDDDCDGSATDNDVVFVAPPNQGAGGNNGGTPSGTGSQGSPVDAIGRALTTARSRGATAILLQGTTFTNDAELVLGASDDVLIIGGYGYDADQGAWSDRTVGARTTLQRAYTVSASRTPQQVVAVRVGPGADAVFEHVDIAFDRQEALLHGPVFFGLRLDRPDSFAYRDGTITMPQGVDGAPGTDGGAAGRVPTVGDPTVVQDSCDEPNIAAPTLQPTCVFDGESVTNPGAGATWDDASLQWLPDSPSSRLPPTAQGLALDRNTALGPLRNGQCLGCGRYPTGPGANVSRAEYDSAGRAGSRGSRSCTMTSTGYDCGSLPTSADGIDGLPGMGGASVVLTPSAARAGAVCGTFGPRSHSEIHAYPGLPGSCGGAGGTAGGDGSTNFGIVIEDFADAEFSRVTLQRGTPGHGGDGGDGTDGGDGAAYIDNDGEFVDITDALPLAAGGPGGGGGGGHGGHGGSVYALYLGGSNLFGGGSCSTYTQSAACGDANDRVYVLGCSTTGDGGEGGAAGRGGDGGESQVAPTNWRSPPRDIPDAGGFDQNDAPDGGDARAGSDGIDAICRTAIF